jgi:peptide/bleomycin uptake transporter
LRAAARSWIALFHSFYPKPKLLFGSMLVWLAVALTVWFAFRYPLSSMVGLPLPTGEPAPVSGLSYFVTNDNLFFYLFFLIFLGVFCLFWHFAAGNHPWKAWSIWGSAFIVFFSYFSVDISVAITYWRGPHYDLLVKAVSQPGKMTVTQWEIYSSALIFFQLASVYIIMAVFYTFFTSHYLFRWRNAMTDYYYSYWQKVRTIEGASQRIQEDTSRFSTTMEDLGTSAIQSFMTLIVYLPLLAVLSAPIKQLPIIGEVPYPLVVAAIFWSVFGTLLMIIAGIKLPGLEFQKQRVEAAFRKELVYGEDDESRARPATVKELFGNVRKNSFRMYWHYMYFNFFRYLYLQTDSIFPTLIMVPSLSAAVITFGAFQQIRDAFQNVTNSFQYLVNSWPTMIELISIYKRLRAFEAAMNDEPLPSLDQEFIEAGNEEQF